MGGLFHFNVTIAAGGWVGWLFYCSMTLTMFIQCIIVVGGGWVGFNVTIL